MSDFIKNAIASGIKRAGKKREEISAEEALRRLRFVSFDQMVRNTLRRHFEDAKRELGGEFDGNIFNFHFATVEEQIQGARFEIVGPARTGTFFLARCFPPEGAAEISGSVFGTPIVTRSLHGDSGGEFEAAFGEWVGSVAEGLATKGKAKRVPV
ncbi:MAG TPA: hypothetical protein VFI49_08155 [Rudaea sp.]|nr:hypothetical protein [Rudaea sp.]